MTRRESRRNFLVKGTAVMTSGVLMTSSCGNDTPARPNILWITSEDNGPHLGIYGDSFATTPHLDRLGADGTIYLNAWSNAPVCAPARTAIITGMYPPSTGAEHMRSMTSLPAGMKMFPQFLRDAGYYCTNNSKEDYNLEKPGQVWDESSTKAHWRNKRHGQPFFAVFNSTLTHESSIRERPHTAIHDPAHVRVPAYHPDHPAVRQDWAQYYDRMTEMDVQAGRILSELEEDGLLEDTIVFYYGDHGPGMPRNKRWPFNCGLRVPMIVRIPDKFRALAPADYQPRGRSPRLVSFVDLAPAVLSLAGIRPPEYMQGHAFLGRYSEAEQPYLYGFRGRMDERYDMVRSVRDKRYVYVRNFMPHKIYGQHLSYMFQTPTTQVWKQLYDRGELNEVQAAFWEPKPVEELYDLETDPDEVLNLARSESHQEVLERMRAAQRDLALTIRDVGYLPEQEIHFRASGGSPYEAGHDPNRYPIQRVMETAELASLMTPDTVPSLTARLADSDSAVRYWAALGLFMRGSDSVQSNREALRSILLGDTAPTVRIVSAQALACHGNQAERNQALRILLDFANAEKHTLYVALPALNALDELNQFMVGMDRAIASLPRTDPAAHTRMKDYVGRLVDKILADLRS